MVGEGLERRLPDSRRRKRRELAGHLVRVLLDAIEATYSGDLDTPVDPLKAAPKTSPRWRRSSGAAPPTGSPNSMQRARSATPTTC